MSPLLQIKQASAVPAALPPGFALWQLGFRPFYLLASVFAALVRVAVPLAAPAQIVNAVLWSAALWSAGFALYAVAYWPVLTRVRVDGKPG